MEDSNNSLSNPVNTCAISQDEEELLNQAIELAQTALFYDQKLDVQKALQYYNQAIHLLETDAKSAVQKKMSVFKIFVDTYKERVKILQQNVKDIMGTIKDASTKNLNEELKSLIELQQLDPYDRIITTLKIFDTSLSRGAHFSPNFYVPYYVWFVECEAQHANFYNRCFFVLSELAEILDAFLECEGKAANIIAAEIKALRKTLLRLYKEHGTILYEVIKSDSKDMDSNFMSNVQGKLNKYKDFVLKNISRMYTADIQQNEQRGVHHKVVFDTLKLLLEALPVIREAWAREDEKIDNTDITFIFAFVRDLILPALLTDLQFRLGAYFTTIKVKFN